MEHQTLDRWVVRPSDTAYYIEDCRIYTRPQGVGTLEIHEFELVPKILEVHRFLQIADLYMVLIL